MNGRITGVIFVVLALAGCASTPDANYSRYVDSIREQQAAEAQQIAALASAAAACNGDTTCVVSVTGFAALALRGNGGQGARIAPPPRPRHWTENVRDLSAALNPALQIFGQIETQKFALEATRSDNEAQLGIVDRLAGGWERSGSAGYDAFGLAMHRPTYNYEIGRDYVPGQIGDNAGRDQIGGNQHIGDWRTGDDVRRDTIGRDRTDYGSGNRIDSPGPYRDVGNEGPRCTGIGCQQTPLPEPEPEE